MTVPMFLPTILERLCCATRVLGSIKILGLYSPLSSFTIASNKSEILFPLAASVPSVSMSCALIALPVISLTNVLSLKKSVTSPFSLSVSSFWARSLLSFSRVWFSSSTFSCHVLTSALDSLELLASCQRSMQIEPIETVQIATPDTLPEDVQEGDEADLP